MATTDTPTHDNIAQLLKNFHPIPPTADGDCPHIEWMGLGHGSGIGEWKCRKQSYQWGDLLNGGGNENTDYKPCNNATHTTCQYYLKSQQRVNEKS